MATDQQQAYTPGPERQDTWHIELKVDNPDIRGSGNDQMLPLGVWDKKTGGKIDSTETIYHPGGMAPPISLGGRQTIELIELQRLYRSGQDHDKILTLIKQAGKGRAQVFMDPMDFFGQRHGRPLVYTGILKSVTPPEVDSEGDAAALYTVEISCAAPPTMSASAGN